MFRKWLTGGVDLLVGWWESRGVGNVGLEPKEALGLWEGFPVGRTPRAVVLMGSAIGPGGAPMVADRAGVLRHAAVVSDVEMPAGVLAALQPDPVPHWQVDPVRVRSVRRVYPEFRTDRGHRPFAAYRVEFAGPMFKPGRAPNPKLEGVGYPPIHVLDPRVEETMWWPAGLSTSYRGGLRRLPGAVLTDRGRTVRLIVYGSPAASTDVRVEAVLETGTAVLLQIKETAHDGVEVIPAVAVGRLVVARLTAPLGARVLVQADGIPIEVLPG